MYGNRYTGDRQEVSPADEANQDFEYEYEYEEQEKYEEENDNEDEKEHEQEHERVRLLIRDSCSLECPYLVCSGKGCGILQASR